MTIAISFVAVVVIGWIVADRDLRSQAIDDAIESTELLRDRQRAVIDEWALLRLGTAAAWADDPELGDDIDALLVDAGRDPDTLVAAPAQADIRDRMRSVLDAGELLGYFVVRPDGLSLASSRDANVATPNLVAVAYPEVFDEILAGNVRFTPIQTIDVPLSASDADLPETMFAAAPVRRGGEVVAVLLLRIQPSLDLGRLLADIDPDDGREHVAFDGRGRALNASSAIDAQELVTVDGTTIADALAGGVDRGTAVETDGSVAAWAFDHEHHIGVLTTFDADAAYAASRAQRRALGISAILVAVLGTALIGLAHAVDVRERTREVVRSERRFRSLVDPSPDAVLVLAPDGSVTAMNAAARERAGIDPSSRPGAAGHVRGIVLDDLAARDPAFAEILERWPIVNHTAEPSVIERLQVHGDGHDSYVRVRFVPIVDRAADREYLVILTDITIDVERELRLEAQALMDPLTGLANRVALAERLDMALGRLQRATEHDGVALMVIDLDNFKTVNDAFGHHAGDRVLTTFADALLDAVRDPDSVGRVGGDEFLVVCEQVHELEVAHELARRVTDRLRDLKVSVGGAEIDIRSSVGVAWTREPNDAGELTIRADRAMLRAKSSHDEAPFVVERLDPGVSTEFSVSLRRDLYSALDHDEFRLHYQPIVANDGRVVAAEALLRWRHRDHGVLAPDRFLPLLVETGFIGPVGRWAVGTAVEQARRWERDGTPITVHVNLSPVELASGALDTLATHLDRTGIDPGLVCVEVTEQAFRGRLLSASSIERLGDLGVHVALDDFGVGASSLSHLRQRPLHTVKLDLSFVQSIDIDTELGEIDRSILRGTIHLAQDLDLDLVAEGVETLTQLDWLADAGCERFQGWAFGKAVPVEEFDPRSVQTATSYTS